jgi:hypothetical protein
MKTLYKFLSFLLICTIFVFCTKEDEVPIDIEVQDFVWKAMNAYYLDQDKISDLSDRRFNSHPELNNYLRQFDNPNTLLTDLLSQNPDGDTKTRLINDYNLLEQPTNRTSVTHGVEYGIIAEPGSTDNVLGYIQYILPNSNAATKNIKRGEFFYKVDDTQLTRDNFRTLLEGSNTYELTMATFDGVKVEEDSIIVSTVKVPKKIRLDKSGYTHNPIFISKTIVSGTNTIGYLMYNNDFSSNYLNDLNNTIAQFNSQNVNQLVLDLRYNIGGGSFTENIVKLGSMITGQFLDQPFLKERWNVKAQPWFEMHQPDSIVTKFTNKLNATTNINSLGLTDVYIILDGSSSSIELLINSLRSYINVHIINSSTTNGNSTGAITLYNSIDYDSIGASPNHTVALQPIVLDFLNSDDATFDQGFTPNLRTCNQEDILNLGELGELSDPILNDVVNFVNGSIPTPPTLCNPNNFEYLFNSVRRQRLLDTGVFIKRDLPNTN